MMTFVIVSLNSELENRLKTLFSNSNIKYRISRKAEIREKDEPSIVLIDIDSIKNKQLIKQTKENQNIINLYLLTKDLYSGGLEFPKHKIIDSFMTTEDVLKLVMSNMSTYTDMILRKQQPSIIPKEEAIKSVSTSNIDVQKFEIEDEEDEDEKSTIESKSNKKDDLDNQNDINDIIDFSQKVKFEKKGIEASEVINEDEDSFDDFDERKDLEKYKNHRIVSAPEQKKSDMFETFHVSNQRNDREIGQKEYMANLNLNAKLRNPKVLGRPMEPIPIKYSPPNDSILTEYRMMNLRKKGFDRMQMISSLNSTLQMENTIREGSLKKRELKRQQYLRQLDSNENESVLTKNTQATLKSDILSRNEQSEFRNELNITPIQKPQAIPLNDNENKKRFSNRPILDDEDDFFVGKKLEPISQENKINNDFELREKNISPVPPKKIIIDDDEEDFLQIFRKKQEEQRKILEDEFKATNIKDKLPSTSLINSDPLAKRMARENVKRAESKTDIKNRRYIDDEPDENPRRKIGFFGKK